MSDTLSLLPDGVVRILIEVLIKVSIEVPIDYGSETLLEKNLLSNRIGAHLSDASQMIRKIISAIRF